ncbi:MULTISPECIES: hypothetical protein [Klebsiella pneumoniae complex]|uniref:hypothetical protein n=1 Tax=Klebsiella pneumoniae complex TaxID=3390273 RepID=UPI0027D7BED1|nr:hypothetical protein [Klebsiella pneumoniae]MDW1186499.1 hypothetical protein [Klebsiella pneumoniae]
MKEKQKMPSTGFVVIRCDDRRIVARLSSFPVCERALMYRRGDLVSFMPLKPDDIVGTPSLFAQMIEKARNEGVNLNPPDSVTIPS